jgi:hypothetical protein
MVFSFFGEQGKGKGEREFWEVFSAFSSSFFFSSLLSSACNSGYRILAQVFVVFAWPGAILPIASLP